MKIAYIIVGEDLAAPLLRRQVIELLAQIKLKNNNLEITILNFQSLFSIINHFHEWMLLASEVKNLGLRLFFIPNICPWPIPNLRIKKLSVGWRPYSVWNKAAAIIFSNLSLPIFFTLNKLLGFKIFHCRSYVSTLAVLRYKSFFSDVKVIFDPRSDYPEEGVTASFWEEGSRDFVFWKIKEKSLLEKSDAVALIGPTYYDHFVKSSASFSCFFAPNNVDLSHFKPNARRRNEIRQNFGYADSTTVFVYLGALTDDGWHRTEFYRVFYEQLKKAKREFSFLLLVPEVFRGDVSRRFSDCDNVKIISPAFSEVGYYLASADIGLMFFHRPKIAVGTKIGEYLCTGLPIVVNCNCVGAVDLIKRNASFGAVIGLGIGGNDNDISGVDDLENIFNLKGESFVDDARIYFNLSSIADSYEKKYIELG